jgi:uncharacterized protein YdhG (YjbR/CyaY superfamily)
MLSSNTKPADVDEYISSFPTSTQQLLKQVRLLILKTAPKALEVISYGMPGYKYHGMLVYFAGYKNHVGFYPGAAPIVAFKKEIAIYKNAKGSIQFPLDKKLPIKLIKDIIEFKMKENLAKAEIKKKKV